MPYIINLGSWQSVFAVPAELVDKHLRLANASYIKVILYLLRHSGEQNDEAVLSRAVGLSESDVHDALRYWTACGLLSQSDGVFSPPEYSVPAEALPVQPASNTAEESAPDPVDNAALPENSGAPKRAERVRYSYSECAEYLSGSDEMHHMLQVLEGMLQKQLNHTEISVFVTLVHWYGLPEACVAMLVEYCQSIGKSSIAYIESTGIGWAGEEINTVELAAKKIERLRSLRSAWTQIRSILDIPERKPSRKEEDFSDRWVNSYHTDAGLIRLAFDRCIDSKGKLSFSYMNGIIDNWRKNGISTVAQAEAEQSQNQPSTEKQNGRFDPTYDKSEIEAVMFDEWFGSDTTN